MRGSRSAWTATALAVIFVVSGPAWGQSEPRLPSAPPVDLASAVLASAETYPADNLTPRVEALEQALRQAEEKAADKNKAAGRPTFEPGGRIFFDHVFHAQDALNKQSFGDAQNGVEFRALRLQAVGKAFEVMDYKLETDWATSTTVIKDIWVGVSDLPVVGNVRAGHFKEPMGLEELTSDSYTTFMERSMGDIAFLPTRNTGFMFFNWSEDLRTTWRAGLFDTDIGDTPTTRIADELAQSFTARVTWLPWYDECTNGRGLLHTGASYSYRHAFHGQRAFATRADEHIGLFYINTGTLNISDYQLYGLEGALVYGPLSLQSESFIVRTEPTADTADQVFTAFYVTVSYFLTGEHRPYRRDLGVFDRNRPLENFFRVRAEDGCIYTGKGAWEVGYRFDYCDVGDAGPSAGLVQAQTLGLNWYLNPYTRVTWNYVHADAHKYYADAGNLDAFLTRVQIDF